MRYGLIAALAFGILAHGAVLNAQDGRPSPGDDEENTRATFSTTLIGSWTSNPDETALSTPFDISVWGSGAKSVRMVRLQVQRSGDASLTVTRSVVDGRGRTVAAATSVESATLRIGGSRVGIATRRDHDVQVIKASRTYPDDPSDRWELEGLKVQIVTFDDDARLVEVRFDTPEGRGSFWETLRPDKAANRRAITSPPGAARTRG